MAFSRELDSLFGSELAKAPSRIRRRELARRIEHLLGFSVCWICERRGGIRLFERRITCSPR